MHGFTETLRESTVLRCTVIPIGKRPCFDICVTKFCSEWRIIICFFVDQYLPNNFFKSGDIQSMPSNKNNTEILRGNSRIDTLGLSPQLDPVIAVVENNFPIAEGFIGFCGSHESFVNHPLLQAAEGCPKGSMDASLDIPAIWVIGREVLHDINGYSVEINSVCTLWRMRTITNEVRISGFKRGVLEILY